MYFRQTSNQLAGDTISHAGEGCRCRGPRDRRFITRMTCTVSKARRERLPRSLQGSDTQRNVTLRLQVSRAATHPKTCQSTVPHSSPSTRLVASILFAASLASRPCPDPSRRLLLSQAEIRLTDPCGDQSEGGVSTLRHTEPSPASHTT